MQFLYTNINFPSFVLCNCIVLKFCPVLLDNCYLSAQSFATTHEKVSQLLELLTRRDDALVKEFFIVLEESDQKHVVDIILDRNTANDDGVLQQQYRPQQGTGLRPREDQVTANVVQQGYSCDVNETEVKMVVEDEASAVHGSLPGNAGIVTARQALPVVNVQNNNEPEHMDCGSAVDGNSLVSETTCKVVDSSAVPVLVSDAVNDVDCSQAVPREVIQLRDYQKELAEPGIEGHNLIICAPTGSGKTYTAGYICQQRRLQAQSEGRRFKAVFIVCIRNLITQQSDALAHIVGTDFIRGADDKLSLSVLFEHFDVIVATAQVLTIYFYCFCCILFIYGFLRKIQPIVMHRMLLNIRHYISCVIVLLPAYCRSCRSVCVLVSVSCLPKDAVTDLCFLVHFWLAAQLAQLSS